MASLESFRAACVVSRRLGSPASTCEGWNEMEIERSERWSYNVRKPFGGQSRGPQHAIRRLVFLLRQPVPRVATEPGMPPLCNDRHQSERCQWALLSLVSSVRTRTATPGSAAAGSMMLPVGNFSIQGDHNLPGDARKTSDRAAVVAVIVG